MNRSVDIAVVGGGVAGATAAALLAADGQRVALIDRARPADPGAGADIDPRVVAISPGSQRILAAADGWSRLDADRLGRYARMQVHAGNRRIDFAASEHGLGELGWIVESPRLRHALWQALADHDDVSVLAPAGVRQFEMRAGSVELQLDDSRRVSCALLVAADGANSRLRRLAGIDTRQWHYNQHALVCHVATQSPNPGIAWQRFTEFGPLALLPLADGRSSIVWSLPARKAAELQALDDEQWMSALDRHQDSPFGAITAATRRHRLPLIRRQAESLVRGRLALLGDAARTVHPLAGQGLNLGLMDAAALAEVLAQWRPDQRTGRALERYQRWRLGSGAVIAGGIHAINELTGSGRPGRELSALGLGLAGALWPVRELFVQRACGIDSDSPRLAREATA